MKVSDPPRAEVRFPTLTASGFGTLSYWLQPYEPGDMPRYLYFGDDPNL